jgi:hypothetical protein
MTAMFVVILLEQILGGVKNLPSVVIGVGASVISLLTFGASDFLIPSMALMLLALTAFKKPISLLSEKKKIWTGFSLISRKKIQLAYVTILENVEFSNVPVADMVLQIFPNLMILLWNFPTFVLVVANKC